MYVGVERSPLNAVYRVGHLRHSFERLVSVLETVLVHQQHPDSTSRGLLLAAAAAVAVVVAQICINILQISHLLFTSYHIMQPRISPPPRPRWRQFWSILATIYNQSQLAERKHVARYWSISAVLVNAHPPPLVITTKLAAAILVVAVVSS